MSRLNSLVCRLFKAELKEDVEEDVEEDGMPAVDLRVQKEFPEWFKEHVSFLLHLSLSYICSIFIA